MEKTIQELKHLTLKMNRNVFITKKKEEIREKVKGHFDELILSLLKRRDDLLNDIDQVLKQNGIFLFLSFFLSSFCLNHLLSTLLMFEQKKKELKSKLKQQTKVVMMQ